MDSSALTPDDHECAPKFLTEVRRGRTEALTTHGEYPMPLSARVERQEVDMHPSNDTRRVSDVATREVERREVDVPPVEG